MSERDEVFKRFAKDNPLAADRMVDILGDQFAREWDVTEAVAFRTLIPRLDYAIRGIPPGVTEVSGPESCGKTALLGAMLAAAQQQGKKVALVATEDCDLEYWKALGVDTYELLLFEAEDGDDAADLVVEFVRDPHRVVAIDSITAMRSLWWKGTPLEEWVDWRDLVQGIFEDVNEHCHWSSALLVSSQVRARKSVDPVKTFAGGTESASRSVLDLFSLRLELSRGGVQDETYTMSVNVLANVLAPPARLVELPSIKGRGINHDLDLIRFGSEMEVITRRGSWYRFFEQETHQGEEEAAAALKGSVVRDMILKEIYRKMKYWRKR